MTTGALILSPGAILTPTLALEISGELPGTIWLGTNSLTWVNGRSVVRVLAEEAAPAIFQAQAVVRDLTGKGEATSWGGLAREVLDWIGFRQQPSSLAKRSLEEAGWHYFLTKCGTWQYGSQWDLAGAYHQLLMRIPTIDVVWTAEGPLWGWSGQETEEKWRRALRALGTAKAVRNALVGCMIGGGPGQVFYSHGQIRRAPSKPGQLYNTGVLVVRTLYEVCELEGRHSDAVYSNTDSVIIRDGGSPTVWPQLGLASRLEAEGQVSVRGIGSYRIGQKETYWHRVSKFVQGDYESDHHSSAGTWRWLETERG